MAAPRPIEGCIGSRIRLIFGDTGSEWLLLLDEDDGSTQWQTHNWSNIPSKVATQLNNCTNKARYVKEVDFGPTGAWYINGIKRDGSSSHSWWGKTGSSSDIKDRAGQSLRLQVSFGSNYCGGETSVLVQGKNGYCSSGNLDDDLLSRIKRIHKRRKTINFVRLFKDGGYFISDDEGNEWKGIGTHCAKELKKSGIVNDLAIAGDGNWVVIRPNSFEYSTGVDAKLGQHLRRFYHEQRERNNRRSREIQEYHQRIERERVEREAREQAERERLEREAREQEERERLEREAREAEERAERERIEREARRVAENEQASRAAALEVMLEERLLEEAKGIGQLNEQLEDLHEHVRKRKRSLQASIEEMPPERRARVEEACESCVQTASGGATHTGGDCVVCHERAAVRAVVPCGHHCLCDDCSDTLSSSAPEARLCPLCRGNLQSTLKIFSAR